MHLKFLIVLGFASGIVSCSSEKVDDVAAFKEKVKGHWYCAPDSDYQEIIFTDSAFIAHGAAYGNMFRYVKYISPDSIHIYNSTSLEGRSKVSFKDSIMTATFNGGQTTYKLISRLADRENDFELLFRWNERMQNILHWEWQNRMASWASGVKFSQWQVDEKAHTLNEKNDLFGKVDDSFVKAMMIADDSYKNTTLPLFHFFDADSDGNDEIGFWGTAGAADEFFKVYKMEGGRYKPWIYEIGRLIHCGTFRDTTWVEIYASPMVGDEGATDSVITYTIARDLKKREAR